MLKLSDLLQYVHGDRISRLIVADEGYEDRRLDSKYYNYDVIEMCLLCTGKYVVTVRHP